MSQFDYIQYYFKTRNDLESTIFIQSKVGLGAFCSWSHGNANRTREITVVSNTLLNVADAVYNLSTDNVNCIPYRICGIKYNSSAGSSGEVVVYNWVNKYLKAISKIPSINLMEIDLSDYLNDNSGINLYEILCNAFSYTGGNVTSSIYVYTDCVGSSTNPIRVTTVYDGDKVNNTFTILAKKYLYVYIDKYTSSNDNYIELFGYRRLI